MILLKKNPQWLMFDGQLDAIFGHKNKKCLCHKSRVLVAEKRLPLAWEIYKFCKIGE
jgi:hypothetical protein